MSGDNPAHFEPGTWHTVEHRLMMNTPGPHDGVLQAWFDGEPAVDDQAFLYRLADATYGIDALYFSTFFAATMRDTLPPRTRSSTSTTSSSSPAPSRTDR